MEDQPTVMAVAPELLEGLMVFRLPGSGAARRCSLKDRELGPALD